MKKLFENRRFVNTLVLLILIIYFAIVIFSSWEKSAIYDEAVNISSGYIYWKTGNFQINKEHLTFWKLFISLPLLFLRLNIPNNLNANQYEIGNKFLYNNNMSADNVLHITRITNALGVVILGFFIFKWSYFLWGYFGASLSLIFYLLSPSISAQASFVNTDFGLTVLTFLSVYYFWLYLKESSYKNLVITSILFGLAQATKVSALLLYPLFLFLGILTSKGKNLKNILISILKIFAIGFIVLSLTYIFYGLPSYFGGISQIFYSVKEGRYVFINGHLYSSGKWYYYLFSFLVKNPLPFLILFFWSIIQICIARKECEIKFNTIFLLTIPIIWFVVASFSHSQLGIRYILPIYPFIFVLMGVIIKKLNLKKISAIICLIIWMTVNNMNVYPHYLTFFNELTGGPKNGYKYLVNDLDGGQDLKGLAKFLMPDDEVILSYYGCAKPEYYSINCQYRGIMSEVIPKTECVNSLNPKRELLAVSASFLQTAHTKKGLVYGWLNKKYIPLQIIGNTIFVYDITNDINAHKNIAYSAMERNEFSVAKREWQRILVIEPKNEEALFQLANIYAIKTLYERAIKKCQEVLKINPESFNAYNLLGQIYGQQGKINESRLCLERAIKVNPNFAEAHYNIAVTYKNMGKDLLSNKAMAKALKLNPNIGNE